MGRMGKHKLALVRFDRLPKTINDRSSHEDLAERRRAIGRMLSSHEDWAERRRAIGRMLRKVPHRCRVFSCGLYEEWTLPLTYITLVAVESRLRGLTVSFQRLAPDFILSDNEWLACDAVGQYTDQHILDALAARKDYHGPTRLGD